MSAIGRCFRRCCRKPDRPPPPPPVKPRDGYDKRWEDGNVPLFNCAGDGDAAFNAVTCETCPETFTLTVTGAANPPGGCTAFNGVFTLTREPPSSTSCTWQDNTFSPNWTLMYFGTVGASAYQWRLQSASGFITFKCRRTATCLSIPLTFTLDASTCAGTPAASLAA